FLRQGAQKLFCFITRGLLGCTDCLLEETDLFDFGFCRLSLKLLFVIRHLYHPCFHFHQYRAHWTVRIMRWCCYGLWVMSTNSHRQHLYVMYPLQSRIDVG